VAESLQFKYIRCTHKAVSHPILSKQ
jgi:hypothetical protein